MPFLSPWMLYGLGALAVPVAIHLWQRRRVVQVPFSTLRFLKLAAARTSRSSRLENLLLLLLRCLVFALLAFAAARPIVSTRTAGMFGGDVPRTVILAIDNSMSMKCRVGLETRLETAKAEALAVIDDLKPGDDVAVLAVNERAQPLIQQPTVDHNLARRMIESIRPGEERSDFSVVFREAAKIVEQGSRGIRELYFFTDNQESGWRFDAASVFDEAWKKSELNTVIVRPDESNAANATVKEVKIKTAFVSAGETVEGTAVVENHSAQPLQDLLEIKLGGERVAQKPVEVGANAAVEVPFEFQAPAIFGRWMQGVASIEGDNLPDDDRFYFSVPVYQPPRVLIVEGQQAGDVRLHSGFYLRKALVAVESESRPRVISTGELDDTALEGFSAVFLADTAGLSDRALVRLDRYLQGGGTVALFPGDLSNAAVLSRLDFLPAKATGIRELPPGRLAVRVTDPAHPLFANAWDAATPFPALPQRKMIDWKINSDAKPLLVFSNNVPFLIFANRGPGRVIIVNASADRAWGDFPLSPSFLPLVQQIARLSAEQLGGHAQFVVGESLPASPSLPRDQALSVKSPDGAAHELPPGERAQLIERAGESGFYVVSSAQDGVVEIVSVNADRRESDLRAIDSGALSKIVPAEIVGDLDHLKLWLAQSRGTVPLWPALLVLALVVFAIEAVLSNVMARHRSQGDSEHIKTGRLNKRRFGVSFHPTEMDAKS